MTMKTIRISDETYEKIAEYAKRDRRTIVTTIDILIERALEAKQYSDTEIAMLKSYAEMEARTLGNGPAGH